MFVVLQDLFVFILGHHYLSKEKLQRLDGLLGKRVTFLHPKLMPTKRHKRNVVASLYSINWKPWRCRVALFSHSPVLKIHLHLRFTRSELFHELFSPRYCGQWVHDRLLLPANEVWGKVVFSQTCVSHSLHSGDLCMMPD